MNLSKVSVKRPVTTFMILLIAIGFGLISILNLKMDMLPNMNIPVAIVMTTYTGAGSEEMENLVTEPLEEQLSSISGLDTMTSQSSEGMSVIIMQFENYIDIDLAAVDMREKVDIAKYSLPDDANDPVIMKIDINSMSNLQLSATCEGMDVDELGEMIEDRVVDRLERVDGVGSVSLTGKREKEIRVVVDEDKLRGYGISESTVSQLLASENATTPMGSIERGTKKLSIRVKGEFENLEEIKNLPITTNGGAVITLGEIANISQEYEDQSSKAFTNGKASINLTIQKQSNANTSNVSKAVFKELEKIKDEMPEVEFLTVLDPAEYINESVQNVFDSLIEGMILAIIVLFIFLRNVRSTLIVGISMPVSVVATFALMYFAGMTLNLMSLGGLTLGIGMLVDNSIVVLESIYKKIEDGQDSRTAAIEGAREVGTSIFASTLTTVAVFLPIVLVGGTVGEMFKDLSYTVTFSLTASMVVALTFVPMACSIFIHPEDVANIHTHKNIITTILDCMGMGVSAVEVGYKHLLSAALKHKVITILIVLVFTIFTGAVIPTMEMDFMPSTDEGTIEVSVSLPSGSNLNSTDKITNQVLKAIDGYEEVKDISYSIGGSGISAAMGASEDSASISMTLCDKKDRDRSTEEIVDEMRTKIKDIAGADIEITASSNSMGSSGGSAGIEIKVTGPDFEQLKDIGEQMVDRISTIPGLSNVKSSVDDASPQTTIKVNREKAKSYGISSSSISSIVRTAIAGSTATTYKVDGNEYDVNVVQDSQKISTILDMENILVPTSTGTNVPLSEVVSIVTEDTPVTITRENQEEYIEVSANASAGSSLSMLQREVDAKLEGFVIPDGYTWSYGGMSEQMAEAFSGLGLALLASLFLVYMIMASQFEGFLHPFIIMFSIPIAITGGMFGLFIAGESISVTSFLGFIMLAGVVVNNGIVLVDYANLLRRERGADILQAMKIAGPARLRPVLMSTLTTVLGLLPMMISTSDGSETMTGLATVVVYGLSLSTLVTLVLIPVLYVILSTMLEKRRIKKEKKREAKKAKVAAYKAQQEKAETK